MNSQKVFIIGGGGMVGASGAYAIALQEIADEVVLIDINEQAAWGQAADINDALGMSDGGIVRTGTYDEIRDDDIVVVTCGAAQKPGQTRLDLLDVNAKIMKDVAHKIVERGAKPFIVVVANPVDAMTYVILKETGLPKQHVMGTGTTLDTFRLRVELANKLEVSDDEVRAFVLGEHGDSSFAAISGAHVGNVSLEIFPGFSHELVQDIDTRIREKAYKIIEAKKSTYFAIGQVIAEVVDALRHEQASILPVCSLAEGEYELHDVVLGLPSIIDSAGVKIIDNYHLSEDEWHKLCASADVVREAINSVR